MINLTDVEKEKMVRRVEAGLAFGGGQLSADGHKNLDSILSGRETADVVVAQLVAKYKR